MPLRRMAAIRFSGMPHRPKPPAISVAPSKRSAIASSALATVLSICDGMITLRDAACDTRAATTHAHRDVHDRLRRRRRLRRRHEGRRAVAGAGGAARRHHPRGPPMDVAAGAVALAQAAPLFPPGTIHIAVVDPGVGGARADILIESGGSLFVGPDNGVLSLAARAPRRVYRIESSMFRRDPVSPTFHGRDVFAPTAGRLAAGRRRRRRRSAASTTIVELGRAAAAQAGRRRRGAGHPRRQLRQPDHVAAGRAVRERRRRRRSDVQVEVEGGKGGSVRCSGGPSRMFSRAR